MTTACECEGLSYSVSSSLYPDSVILRGLVEERVCVCCKEVPQQVVTRRSKELLIGATSKSQWPRPPYLYAVQNTFDLQFGTKIVI